MKTIYDIAMQTPWWVWLLFVFLIVRGVKAAQTQVVPLSKLFILPVIFTFLSIHTLITAFHITTTSNLVWFASILLGTGIGWALVARHTYRVDKKNWLIEVPGSWITMALIIIIFSSKYYLGYELGVDPAMAKQSIFEFTALGISGICTGLFIGRLLVYLKQFHALASVDLSDKEVD